MNKHIIKELVSDVLTVTLETLYDYDINGNILSISRNKLAGYYTELPSLIVYHYNDAWKDLLTSIEIDSDVYTLDYDNIGNVITIKNNGITVEEFEWNGRELVEYSDNDNIIEYSYNYQGIRVQKVIKDKDTLNVIKIINYVVDESKILAEIFGENDQIIYRYNNKDNVIGFNYNNIEYLYIKNLQNDITGIMDLNGTILVSYEYDAYGNIISVNDITIEGIGSKNPFRYRSYYYDTETGYYYLNSRYYNPEIGRFINADAASVILFSNNNIIGNNLLIYCCNNPVNFCDPSGYFSLGAIIGGIIGLGAGAILIPMLVDMFGAKGFTRVILIGLGIGLTTFLGALLGYYAGKAFFALYTKGGQIAYSLNQAIAKFIAKITGGTFALTAGDGFKITIKNLVIRVMNSGGPIVNYIRISVPGKGSYTLTGVLSSDLAATHIPITIDNLIKVVKLIIQLLR